MSLSRTLVEYERKLIELALADSNGRVIIAARYLGIHRGDLYRRMKRLGLRPDDYRPGKGAGEPAAPSNPFEIEDLCDADD